MNLEFILMLMFCLTAIDLVKLERRNVALNKTVTASSVFDGNDYWLRKENIVDGGLVRNGEACQCCFATQYSTNPWITIDLEQEFAVDLVTVYGRTDHNPPEQNLQGLQLHVVKASDVQDDGVFTVTSEGSVNFANISLKEAEKARYITLVLPGNKYLALCEVEAYKAECVPGTYGNVCSQICGECSDGEICDIDNGECQSCKPGFQGPKCQQACDPGTYGQECIMSCGNCDANQPCDPITGECDKCATGYKGTNCLSECEAGTYGENCSAICGPCKNYDACHHITGFCKSGCIPGRLGDFCKQKCVPGTYGNACSQTCGECSDGEICDIDNGECHSCKPGFQGPKCQQACDPGTYGQECIMSCGNCDANQPCDPITGECDKCATGYKGTNCLSECEAGTYGENCSAICGPCKNYDACHHITGFCKIGCLPGRHGDLCKQESMEDGGCEVVSLSIFIAVVAILVCVIVIFAATMLCFLRKWNNRPPIVQSTVTKETTSVTMETRAVTNETDEHTYDDLHGEVNPLPSDGVV